MACPRCGFLVGADDKPCPRCSGRVLNFDKDAQNKKNTQSLIDELAHAVKPMEKRGKYVEIPREEDKPREGIKPLHGILFFFLVGVPSIIALAWVLTHAHG